MSMKIDGVARLDQLGVLRAQGEDAVKFLQGQLTQDVALLSLHEARLTAWCNAKGRMLASAVVFKHGPDDLLLVLHTSILAAVLKRLSMFVLRSKLQLSDVSQSWQVFGIAGASAQAAGLVAATPWSKVDVPLAVGQDGAPVHAHAVSLYPALGEARGLWVTPQGSPPPPGPALDSALWDWAEVQSGVAAITAPIVEAFVPQMLNYESVGGVSFKKGCYPGQEVVARSQFRGTLKRRAFVLHADSAAQVGQELYQSDEPEQACGAVAACAASPGGGFDLIASMQVSAAAPGHTLHLGQADGPLLSVLPLPYALLDDL